MTTTPPIGSTGSTGSSAGPGFALAPLVSAATARIAATAVAVPATPAVMATWAPSAAATPLMAVLAGVVSVFGVNGATAPTNPMGALVWGLFRQIEKGFGLTPVAGTPTVSTPNPTTGVVTGALGFTEPAGRPLTYTVTTNPALRLSQRHHRRGLHLHPDHGGPPGRDQQHHRHLHRHRQRRDDGHPETVTVPVLPLTDIPVAGTPIMGTPNPSTGVVTGTRCSPTPAVGP